MGRLFIILRPRAREGEWDVFFSYHPKTYGQGGRVGRLFLSSSYRPRAREGEWGVFFSHHPKDLGPGRESGTSFSLIIL